MKNLIAYFIIFGLIFSRGAFAQEEDCPAPAEPELIFAEEEDDYFNKGTFVGNETDEYLRARQRVRNRNWAVAIGTTALGIATLVLVGQNHNHHHHH